MGSRAVSCWENFARYNESRRVRPEVLEEVGEAVEHDKAFGGCRCSCKLVITEAYEKVKVSLASRCEAGRGADQERRIGR